MMWTSTFFPIYQWLIGRFFPVIRSPNRPAAVILNPGVGFWLGNDATRDVDVDAQTLDDNRAGHPDYVFLYYAEGDSGVQIPDRVPTFVVEMKSRDELKADRDWEGSVLELMLELTGVRATNTPNGVSTPVDGLLTNGFQFRFYCLPAQSEGRLNSTRVMNWQDGAAYRYDPADQTQRWWVSENARIVSSLLTEFIRTFLTQYRVVHGVWPC